MCAVKMGTIYTPIHQVPTAAVNDTADLLIERRKLTVFRIDQLMSEHLLCTSFGRKTINTLEKQVMTE